MKGPILGKEHLTNFLLYPTPSLFDRPDTHRLAISQLEGLQYEGLPGFFPFPVSGRRLGIFHRQIIDVSTDGLAMPHCDFYERIRSSDDLISAAQLYGALLERDVPFKNLPQQIVAVAIFPSIFDAPNGIVPLPEPDERSIGDHLVITLGFGREHLYFLNNWGPEWGIQGIGCFSVDYLNHFQREAWSTRWLTGPHPDLSTGMESGVRPNKKRWRRLLKGTWDQNESTEFMPLHRGAVLDVFGRWLIGFSDGSVWLQCVAVLHESKTEPLIVGWMHIRDTSDGADIEELFVWPTYRERGIGTALAGQALLYAAVTPWQHGRWQWHKLEADTIMTERGQWKPRIPDWLRRLISNPDGEVTNQKQFLSLLERLAKSQSLDGVRLLRDTARIESTTLDYVLDDDQNPSHGVIIATKPTEL